MNPFPRRQAFIQSIGSLTAAGDRLQSVEESRPAEQNVPVDLDIGGRVRGIRGLARGPHRGIHRHWDDRGAWILQTGGDQAKSRRRCVRDSGNGMGRGYTCRSTARLGFFVGGGGMRCS